MEKIECPKCGEMVTPMARNEGEAFYWEWVCICPECGAVSERKPTEYGAVKAFKDGKLLCSCEIESKEQPQPDMVSHPSHYINDNGVECQSVIDYVLDNLVLTASAAYWLGCSIKYLFRYTRKGKPVQDLDKALFCFKKAIKKLKKYVAKSL